MESAWNVVAYQWMIKPRMMILKCQRLNVLTEQTPVKEGREHEHSLEIGILIGNSSTKVNALTPDPVLYLKHFKISGR